MMPGETIASGASPKCPDCGHVFKLEVLKTCAYYVGTCCPNCGPWSRETGYFKTREEAEAVLADLTNGNILSASKHLRR